MVALASETTSRGYVLMLCDETLGKLTTPVQKEALLEMKNNVNALQEMITKYLQLTKIESGQLTPDKRTINLYRDSIQPVVEGESSHLAIQNMQVVYEQTSGLENLMVTADPALMRIVYSNLITNALKYGRSGGTITLGFSEEPTHYRFHVKNDGPGIPKERLNEIFGKFVRFETKELGNQIGTGLGLSCPNDGRINASYPCSEYMFLDDTACNLASLNLMSFFDPAQCRIRIEEYLHAIRLWTLTLEISVAMAQYPSREIALNSYRFRTLGLGCANLGALLMVMGLPYDSKRGRNLPAGLMSIMTGGAYRTSAEMAQEQGPFPRYGNNSEPMLRVIRNQRRAAYGGSSEDYECLHTPPAVLDQASCPDYVLAAAQRQWDEALDLATAGQHAANAVLTFWFAGRLGSCRFLEINKSDGPPSLYVPPILAKSRRVRI